MIEKGSSLLVEVTDGTDYRYRGNLPYGLTKSSIINLAHCLPKELQPFGDVTRHHSRVLKTFGESCD
ncbi:hypothetical protein LEP1GSC058_3911 [Leptospira fainei serovar Hurstbridge str. BUT 6]|uniref:Uncharacterized protein n=1 Tax=Leptospira fainei serovar Hurstbridge str. BUT 6 TaxID=1193011 RepID=S3UVK6_9LEPT|nr:hypothetical protein LEP1GSC058_3911 [Leptospira fainei serovar Hurstbridge str. BUT 6]